MSIRFSELSAPDADAESPPVVIAPGRSDRDYAQDLWRFRELADAHAASVEAVRRLDGIAAEIDGAVANQAALALDTALGAREFQKFLIAKQREIAAVVSTARELGDAKKAVLDALHEHYSGPAG